MLAYLCKRDKSDHEEMMMNFNFFVHHNCVCFCKRHPKTMRPGSVMEIEITIPLAGPERTSVGRQTIFTQSRQHSFSERRRVAEFPQPRDGAPVGGSAALVMLPLSAIQAETVTLQGMPPFFGVSRG